MGTDRANRRQTDIHQRIDQLGAEIAALKRAVAIVTSEPPSAQRDQDAAVVHGAIHAVETTRDEIAAHLSDEDRPRFRVITGGLAGIAGVLGSGAAVAARRTAAHHPVAAATAAGTVAVVATAGAILYYGGSGGDDPTAAPPPPTPTAGHRRPQRAPTMTAPQVPGRTRPSATTSPKAGVTQPPAPRPDGNRWPTAGPSPTPGRPIVSTSPTPPVSPSPPDQHPTCVRLTVTDLASLRLCIACL